MAPFATFLGERWWFSKLSVSSFDPPVSRGRTKYGILSLYGVYYIVASRRHRIDVNNA
jgi:hypothetical protein